MTATATCNNCILLLIITCNTSILAPSVLNVFLQSRQYLEHLDTEYCTFLCNERTLVRSVLGCSFYLESDTDNTEKFDNLSYVAGQLVALRSLEPMIIIV